MIISSLVLKARAFIGRCAPGLNFASNIVIVLSESIIPSWVVRLSSHMGAEKHPTVGSSGEFWSRNESLNQHNAYGERSDWIVKAMKVVKLDRSILNVNIKTLTKNLTFL